ncbi:glycosyl hydrolase [Spirochaetia bacterium]|nr:glycosyl hydrolase [Spirochaetia bacterium]
MRKRKITAPVEKKTLLSRWGKNLDRALPWNEYPRPQLKRDNWQNLNGPWEYCITEATGAPLQFDGEIIVPFSPESALSGVGHALLPGQRLWYRRTFTVETLRENARLLLNFGAVDQNCTVYVNGKSAGSHEGGYWPFSFDITELLIPGSNTLSLEVTDESDRGKQAYGKQSLDPKGIWYSAQSGIWQTVWTEWVPSQYIRSLKITPLYDEAAVELELDYALPEAIPAATIEVYDGETLAASASSTELPRPVAGSIARFRVSLPGFKSWSPESPFLYTLRIKAGEDTIESYFGMRKFGVVRDKDGLPRLGLNGKPYFHNGLLDQGYWSDGLYTPPCDEAQVWELTELKRLGFNMLRKHIKIENLRWYYHCDRLGIIVWQDFVSGGGPYIIPVITIFPFILGINFKDNNYRRFAREDPEGRAVFEGDMSRTVALLYNAASIAVWVPFNEGWGQFDSIRITEKLRTLDKSRIIDHASGWHDQGGGDLYSRHVYFKRFRFKADPSKNNRVPVLSEAGGYSCSVKDHVEADKAFGYRSFKDTKSLSAAWEQFYREEIFPAIKRGLSAVVYTQVSDVESEVNGIFTYDREKTKVDEETLIRINGELR